MNVVSLTERLKQKTPHAAGDFKCAHCSHTWVGVAPLPLGPVECPACGLLKGLHTKLLCYDDHEHFHCECGCAFFSVVRSCFYCIQCGRTHNDL